MQNHRNLSLCSGGVDTEPVRNSAKLCLMDDSNSRRTLSRSTSTYWREPQPQPPQRYTFDDGAANKLPSLTRNHPPPTSVFCRPGRAASFSDSRQPRVASSTVAAAATTPAVVSCSVLPQAPAGGQLSPLDYVCIPKTEYDAIRNRVDVLERRISAEFIREPPQPPPRPPPPLSSSAAATAVPANRACPKPPASSSSSSVVSGGTLDRVQSAYEHTLSQQSKLNASTDRLARRISRDLKIRRPSNERVQRSPSARRISSLKRRSLDVNVTTATTTSCPLPPPKSALKRGKPNTLQTGLPARRSLANDDGGGGGDSGVAASTAHQWICASGYFTRASPAQSSSVFHAHRSDRASIALLRKVNAGVVLERAKQFDEFAVPMTACTAAKQRQPTKGATMTTPPTTMTTATAKQMRLRSDRSSRVTRVNSPNSRQSRDSPLRRNRRLIIQQQQQLMAASTPESSPPPQADRQLPYKLRRSTTPLKEVNGPLALCLHTPNSLVSSGGTAEVDTVATPTIRKPLSMRSAKKLSRTPTVVSRATPLKAVALSYS